MKNIITLFTIMGWLQEVKDPEIPVISLIDLGVAWKKWNVIPVKTGIC